MPLRKDLKSVLLIGSGPIVIGQACEFDYSGTQALKALREEGLRLILVNSNPATIMTDPELADRTYIEPMTAAALERIIERERPDALLPTVGGQTALNLAIELAETGVLERFGVELIGAKLAAIKKAEDRDLFKQAMIGSGWKCRLPESRTRTSRPMKSARVWACRSSSGPRARWAARAVRSRATLTIITPRSSGAWRCRPIMRC